MKTNSDPIAVGGGSGNTFAGKWSFKINDIASEKQMLWELLESCVMRERNCSHASARCWIADEARARVFTEESTPKI